jgi:hypothetical protein
LLLPGFGVVFGFASFGGFGLVTLEGGGVGGMGSDPGSGVLSNPSWLRTWPRAALIVRVPS